MQENLHLEALSKSEAELKMHLKEIHSQLETLGIYHVKIWKKHENLIKSELILFSTPSFFKTYCNNNLIFLISKNMVSVVVWILLRKRKIMLFEISKIKLLLQYFLKNNSAGIQISSLLIKFSWFFHKINNYYIRWIGSMRDRRCWFQNAAKTRGIKEPSQRYIPEIEGIASSDRQRAS